MDSHLCLSKNNHGINCLQHISTQRNFEFRSKSALWRSLCFSKGLRDVINQKTSIVEYYISAEKHADRTPPLHALLKFSSELQVKNCHFFDVLSSYHPYIQSTKKYASCQAYVCKDGDFIASQAEDPSIYLKNHTQVLVVADSHFRAISKPYVAEFTNFVVSSKLAEWVNNIGSGG